MGHQIIQQPDGLYAVWSSMVQDFVLVNAMPADIVEMELKDRAEEITRRVNAVIQALDNGRAPYFQFTQTFEQACAFARQVHGVEWKFLGDEEEEGADAPSEGLPEDPEAV